MPELSETAIMRKVTLRLIPFLFLLYVVAYLDRTNVGIAKLAMQPALGFSDSVYGFGTGIFFIGYFFFEVPSNLLLARVGARTWIARIMFTWGLFAMAMILTKSATSFYFLRFLLGVAEAGFFPGMILYLTYWFTSRERGRIIAWFMTATVFSNIVGSPISGALLKVHLAPLVGWQWLFILEGVPAVLLAIVVLLYLPNGPQSARWLSQAERDWVTRRIEEDRQQNPRRHVSFADALKTPTVWLLALLYFLIVGSQYGVVFWLPTIVKGFGGLSNQTVSILSALPYIGAAIGMIVVGTHSDRTGERHLHVALPSLWGAVFLAASAFAPNPTLQMTALFLAAVGMWAALGPFWALPTTMLAGPAAAGGIALINSIGNLGGFLGPSEVGWIKDFIHKEPLGTQVTILTWSASVFLGGLLAWGMKRQAQNRPVLRVVDTEAETEEGR